MTQGTVPALFAEAERLHGAGEVSPAIAAYQQVLARDPGHAPSLHGLGLLAHQTGRHEIGAEFIGRAIAVASSVAAYHAGLAGALRALGRLDEAETAYRRALALAPGDALASNNLGNLLTHRGRADEAITCYERALAARPGFAEAHYNLANLLQAADRLEPAIAHYRQAIAQRPDFLPAHNNLGNAHRKAGQLESAIAAYDQVLALQPDNAEAHNNLGLTFMLQGRLDDAAARYEHAISLKPDYQEAHTNLLMWLNYSDRSPREIFAAHIRWGETQARTDAPAPYPNGREPERRLRIGYVSPDFRAHSVAWFLRPLLAAHDPAEVEVFAYAEVPKPDGMTAILRAECDHWRSTVGVSDAALAQQIRADGIDVLVDVAGHTGANRLTMFALKPAPVQVTWLGYLNTTGLAAMDYRIVDAITDPPGAEAFATETLVRLADGFVCFAPMEGAPEPGPPPSAAGGAITYGSFNNPAKLGEGTLDVWSEILARTQGSTLLLKGASLDDEGARTQLLDRFAARGIAPERVRLLGLIPSTEAHLALYNSLDIGLDPFPYNGVTTTCEALWMGLPVIALNGDRHCARISASLLTRVGLDELVARDLADYVDIAVRLANDPVRLAEIRRTLRPRMAASPLCEAAGFARAMEGAYRDMWRAWCAAQGVG